MKKKISSLKIKLSLFEVLTLIYILAASKQKKVNYNLVEAGLLFKGDSTRLWEKPFLQICTNINMQHLEWINPKSINEIFRLCYYGLRFDTSAIVYVNSIFILLSILPFYKTLFR